MGMAPETLAAWRAYRREQARERIVGACRNQQLVRHDDDTVIWRRVSPAAFGNSPWFKVPR